MIDLREAVARNLSALLREYAGADVSIATCEPISEGWSAQFVADPWPWVVRCTVRGASGLLPPSVIVKLPRPDTHPRSAPEQLLNERVALEFLASIGSTVGPRLLAADERTGMLLLEDLGSGPALDDLLVGKDTAAAQHALIAFATTLGRMHARTSGHAAAFYRLRGRYGSIDPPRDRISILEGSAEHKWHELQAIVAGRSYLPAAAGVDADIDELLGVLAEPGPYLAFSNGDTCPQNCKLTPYGPRLLDFEHAAFRHALLDAAALRFPFPACPCWSRLPAEVGQRAEEAYRAALARACPAVLDPASYNHGLTVACAAWTIVRLVRLPQLERVDQPHPMGCSRRGQLLDNIGTTLTCARRSGSLLCLAAWLENLDDALRRRWPHLTPSQPRYPAFGTHRSS